MMLPATHRLLPMILPSLAKLIALINKRVTIALEGIGTLVKQKGYHACYNDMDLYQTRDNIKVGFKTYIG